MGQGKAQNLQDLWSRCGDHHGIKKRRDMMMMMMNNNIVGSEEDQDASSSSIGDDSSTVSNGSSSSNDDDDNDTRDDASSTVTCSSSSNSIGALYDLSELMSQLPIKRGLSQYYNGKSDSFTCLSRVTSIEDLAKKEAPYNSRRRNNKGKSKSGYRLFTLPKPIISKKISRSSLPSSSSISSSSSNSRRRRSFMNANSNSSSRPPQIPFQKAFNGG